MLSNKPQNIDEFNWYYENNRGIQVIHEVRDKDGIFIQTDHIYISWNSLEQSLMRKEAKSTKRHSQRQS